MKFALRGASSAALIVGIFGGAAGWAQEGPVTPQEGPAPQTVTTQQAPETAAAPQQVDAVPQEEQSAGDRVVITGSLIATTPEDAPKPVEVYSAEDLAAQGSPSSSDFLRSLSVSASSGFGFGQASADVIGGAGFANADLRGTGSSGTMVLFNGRRLASTNGGFGADINTIPMEALGSVEVLKDGASATYGAGAVGGVINFTTRRDIDAPQINLETTQYDGSSSVKIDALTGWVGDSSNFLIAASHFHEDPLEATERDFGTLPYALNPAGYTNTASSPGRFLVTAPGVDFYNAPALGLQGANVTAAINDYRGGVATTYAGVTDQGRADCNAVGGYIYGDVDPGTDAATVSKTLCGFNENLMNQLVSAQTTDRLYAEFNADISETMSFHVDGIYHKSYTEAVTTPSATASASAIDASVGAYVAPRNVALYNAAGVATGTTVANPFIGDFLTRTGATTGANGAVIIPASAWRPYMYSGNPVFGGDGREVQKFTRERFMVNAGVNGEFQSDADGLMGFLSFLNGIKYDYAVQYNQYKDDRVVPAIFRSRVQNALVGYGGPNCQAQDRVATDYTSAESYSRTIGIQSDTAPGTNGCEFFNPFASAYATSIATGLSNPQYGGSSFENSTGLARWLTQEDRNNEQLTESVTFDALFSGTIPETVFALPGGAIGWAIGSQVRGNELRATYWSDSDQERRMITQQCPWPDVALAAAGITQNLGASPTLNQRGCVSTQTGVYLAAGLPGTTNSTIVPDFLDSQTVAYFTEVQLPVLDNLNLSASYRHESYNDGKIGGGIWSVAGKYSITDNIYIRASHGTNFRAEGALDATPGQVTQGVAAGAAATFGTGFNYATRTTVGTDLGVEDDKTTNIGVGIDYDIGEGRLRASADYFEILLDGVFGTAGGGTILANVFPTGSAGFGSSGVQANCGASLISFVTFTSPCVQGTTTAAQIALVDQQSGNFTGFVTDGWDYSIDYTQPLLGGDFSASATATNTIAYKFKGFALGGVPFIADFDLLGGFNGANHTTFGFAPPSGVSPSQKWRGNATLRWSTEQHSFSLRANYLSGVRDNRNALGFTPVVNNTVNATDVVSTYGAKRKDYMDYDLTYIWTTPFWQDFTIRASVLNVMDKDPLPFQGSNGYFVGAGDPRGRRFELGLNKKF